MNITSTQSLRAQSCPEHICLQTSNQTFNHQEWEEITRRAAGWLLSHGQPGDTVAVIAQNRWETLALFCGAVRAGFVFMPLDPRMTELERKERLQQAAPVLTVQAEQLEEAGNKIRKTKPSFYCSENADVLFYAGFTSGSSGTPKQFVRNQQSWLKSFEAGMADFPLTGQETAVIAGPIHHSLFLYGAAFALFCGQPIRLLDKFRPDQVAHLLNTLDSFVFYAVPTMLEALESSAPLTSKGLVFLSGAGWTAERKQQWIDRCPSAPLYEFYGASELSFVSYMTPDDYSMRPASSGKPSTGVTVEIRSGGKSLPAGQIGTIYVKSPMLFSGYMQAGRLELDIEADGFYTVGDAGYIDQDGFLYIAGREQFMMITGGVNVYPEEIERIVLQCPAVKEAAVTSIQDPYLGDRVVCFYSGQADRRAVRFFTKQFLSVQKRPRHWIQVEKLPLTTNGKIDRKALQKLAKEMLQ
ncbi:AMP-binding protein [Domibacillus robiginosus]|uniref:AMP-binding protein n=1 Tax=Domibacillus robiginosus TaxID=1071054 RepID=UPI00067B0B89|nr:AMP-binding protein [Domibacillus robiginosus]